MNPTAKDNHARYTIIRSLYFKCLDKSKENYDSCT